MNIEQDQILIKVMVCCTDEEPRQIYQLSANSGEEYRSLLKHLEMFADILPYLIKAEQEAKDRKDNFEWNITKENMKAALYLNK